MGPASQWQREMERCDASDWAGLLCCGEESGGRAGLGRCAGKKQAARDELEHGARGERRSWTERLAGPTGPEEKEMIFPFSKSFPIFFQNQIQL